MSAKRCCRRSRSPYLSKVAPAIRVIWMSFPRGRMGCTVDLPKTSVLVQRMNIATTRGTAKSSLSLPNILTYARIAAVPVVVGCIFAQSIMDGPLWLRWVAVAVFIAAGVTDYLDGYYARIWNQQSAFGRMLVPDPCVI